MKKVMTILICGVIVLAASKPLMAKGQLKRLQGLAESMGLQQEELDRESANYRRAEEFINSPDIKTGLSADAVLKRCGEPASEADSGMRWVYKPQTSTFFKGEKIYFFFDRDKKLTSWEKITQQ